MPYHMSLSKIIPGLTEDHELVVSPVNGWYDNENTVCTIKVTARYDEEEATAEMTLDGAVEAAVTMIQATPDTNDPVLTFVVGNNVDVFGHEFTPDAAIALAVAMIRQAAIAKNNAKGG